MRIHTLLAPLLVSTSLACEGSNDPAVATPSPSAESPSTSDPAANAPIQAPGTIQAPTSKPITLDGYAPAGQTVVVVDAGGVRHEAVADDTGNFHIAEVLTPYDIATTFEDGKHAAWTGATRLDPTLAQAKGAEPVSATLDLTVAVVPPHCLACTMTVVTTSLHGAGIYSQDYGDGATTLRNPIAHQFKAFTASEGVTADVLVDPHDGTHYWYGHAYLGQVAPGSISTVPIATIGLAGVSTVVLHDTGVPSSNARMASMSLTFGRKVSIELVNSQAASAVAHVPNIPGAELQAEARTWGFMPGEKWITGGKSGFFPLSTSQIDVEGAIDFEPEIPAANTTISITAPKISWKRPQGAVTRFTIGATYTAQTTLIVTPQPSLDRARLGALGIDTLVVGQQNIGLSDEPVKTTDEALAADYTPPSPTAFHNFPFTVTE